jgi:hypothetical protein
MILQWEGKIEGSIEEKHCGKVERLKAKFGRMRQRDNEGYSGIEIHA